MLSWSLKEVGLEFLRHAPSLAPQPSHRFKPEARKSRTFPSGKLAQGNSIIFDIEFDPQLNFVQVFTCHTSQDGFSSMYYALIEDNEHSLSATNGT